MFSRSIANFASRLTSACMDHLPACYRHPKKQAQYFRISQAIQYRQQIAAIESCLSAQAANHFGPAGNPGPPSERLDRLFCRSRFFSWADYDSAGGPFRTLTVTSRGLSGYFLGVRLWASPQGNGLAPPAIGVANAGVIRGTFRETPGAITWI